MTFTYKLAKRLALSRFIVTASTLAALSACGGGDTLSPATPPSGDPQQPSPTVGSVVLTPRQSTTQINQSVAFAAYGRSSAGDSVPVAVSWSASGGAITSSGQFAAPAPGTYRIVARAVDATHLRDSTEVTVVDSSLSTTPPAPAPPAPAPPAPAPAAGSHEPAGFRRILDLGFTGTALAGAGYEDLYGGAWNTSRIGVVNDPTAPRSASSVLQYSWRTGDGQSPGRAVLLFGGARKLYVSVWFQHSAGWQFNSTSTNKVIYFGNNDNGQYDGETFINYRNDRRIWFCLQSAQGYVAPYNPSGDAHRFLPPNVVSTTVQEGRWHQVEVLMEQSTGGQTNGRVRWWVDGALNGDYSDIRFNGTVDALFDAINIDPIWGGGGTKSHPDWLRFDHLYVSGQ